MKTAQIKVYASLSREYLWGIGEKLGLSEEAKRFLIHFIEVPLMIKINKDTGEVVGAEIPKK